MNAKSIALKYTLVTKELLILSRTLWRQNLTRRTRRQPILRHSWSMHSVRFYCSRLMLGRWERDVIIHHSAAIALCWDRTCLEWRDERACTPCKCLKSWRHARGRVDVACIADVQNAFKQKKVKA